MWGVFIKVKMSRRPSGKYPEMPMRVTDRRMSLVNATPQKYNPSIFSIIWLESIFDYTLMWFCWPKMLSAGYMSYVKRL